jgi:hypothetical protein
MIYLIQHRIEKKAMKVKELIEKLQALNQDLEVTITDGFNARFWGRQADGTDFDVYETMDFGQDGEMIKIVDIGIGGCEL